MNVYNHKDVIIFIILFSRHDRVTIATTLNLAIAMTYEWKGEKIFQLITVGSKSKDSKII
jgi:hypothetical protein